MPLDPTLNELSDQQWSPQDIASMTHQPEQPNPAAPYLESARKFAGGGLSGVFPQLQSPTLSHLAGGLSEAASYTPALGIMGGGRGFGEYAARTGDTSMIDLEMAKQMEAQGMTRSQIRGAKEWYKKWPSGVWNKEIFDDPSTLNELEMPLHANYQSTPTTVGKVLNHPDLYDVYPRLKDMPLVFKNDPAAFAENNHGGYGHPRPGLPDGFMVINNAHRTSPEHVKSVILHELQHAVDMYEGRHLRSTPGMNIDDYFKLAEEARARNTQYRAKYTPEQLKQPDMDPWLTMRQMHEPIREHEMTLPP